MMKNKKYVLGILAVAILISGAVGDVYCQKQESPATIIVVTSTSDSGPGTLRQALLEAQSSDIITFDPTVFPPNAPATIAVMSELPHIHQSNLTLDASQAGVILDGSHIPGEWVAGLQIVSSEANTIWGLQVSHFHGPGIAISGDAKHNVIGGNRSLGAGPFGRGNLFSNNEIGIDLSTTGTTLNTVTENLIGTDTEGTDTLGNYRDGVSITEGAHNNVIGPDNIIAYNNEDGIAIHGSNSLGNTITQNSIHDNGRQGIGLWEGGNAGLPAPSIFDFDLAAGTVTGATSANCTIEIFSDSSNEGEVYEGWTTADSAGVFSFNKGASFTGPHLTATATDADGNTNGFSTPTSGTSRSTNLQEGNNQPKTQLQPKQSRELEDNRIFGTWSLRADFHTEQEADDFVDMMNNMGFKRVHVTIDWRDWEQAETTGEYSRYYIDPNHDKVITGLADNGMKIIYCLVFWDEEIQPEQGYARFEKEEEIQRYLDYAQFIVHNFKDRIEYYEIMNEPRFNEDPNSPFHQQNIEPVDYINLVNRSVQVIRQEYPEAKIVVGANVLFYERDYFFGILESDIMPLVDAVSWHPMYGTSPEYDDVREYYYNYPSIVQEIKDVASAHGFQGEYMCEEIGWSVNPPPDQPWVYSSETVCAKYYGRGIVMHLGMDVTTGVGGTSHILSLPKMVVIRNLCTIMAGTEPVSLPVEIQSEATNIRSYSFSLPNGDKLIALWTDGVAVDEDPGVKANLTLQGFTGRDVMGIDVLNGFQQPIIASSENGNLTIRNLIVRDYSLILSVAKISTTLSCSVSFQEIKQDESITVSGSISPAIEGVTVTLTYTKPDGTTLNRTVTTASDGSFSDAFEPDMIGVWYVTAGWEGDEDHHGSESSLASFTVLTDLTHEVTWKDVTYRVRTVANSTVSSFLFNQPAKQISFNVTGPLGKIGFCNVTVPKVLLGAESPEAWTVTLDDDTPPLSLTITENDTYTFISLTYGHSTRKVTITGTTVIPEFPPLILLSLFILVTMVAIILPEITRMCARKGFSYKSMENVTSTCNMDVTSLIFQP